MFIEKFARILAQRDEGLPHVSNFPQEIAKISQILKGSKQIQSIVSCSLVRPSCIFPSGFSSNVKCFLCFKLAMSALTLCESQVLIPRLFSTCATSRSCQKFNGGRAEGVENGQVPGSFLLQSTLCLHVYIFLLSTLSWTYVSVEIYETERSYCFSVFHRLLSMFLGMFFSYIKLRDFRLQLDNRATGFMGMRQNPDRESSVSKNSEVKKCDKIVDSEFFHLIQKK